jgi:hypothetical protein
LSFTIPLEIWKPPMDSFRNVESTMADSPTLPSLTRRTFMEYNHILVHTYLLGILDFGFYIWTVRRTAGTLRVSRKKDRPPQKVVAFLKGYEETDVPEKMVHVAYDTGLEKKGMKIKGWMSFLKRLNDSKRG